MIDVVMPQLGESVAEGTVTKWLVRRGDAVARDQVIVEVATDKADTEVRSPAAGVVTEILVQEGSVVPTQKLLCRIDDAATTAVAAPVSPSPAAASSAQALEGPHAEAAMAVPPAGEAAGEAVGVALSSPSTRRFARELGVDIRKVQPTGEHGRVTRDDVVHAAHSHASERAGSGATAQAAASVVLLHAPAAPAIPEVPRPGAPSIGAAASDATAQLAALIQAGGGFTPPLPGVGFGAYKVPAYTPRPGDEVVPFNRRRRITADHMVYSKVTSPHVVTVAEVDLFATSKLRDDHKDRLKKAGVPLTFLAFIAAATVRALREHPTINARVLENAYVVLRDVNLGIAVDTEGGLIVPSLKHADSLSLRGIAQGIDELATRARAGKITADDLANTTFTVSNPGQKGNLFGAAIISQPNVGILRMGEIKKRPVVVTRDGEDAIAIHPVMYMALSYDHRIIDGVLANSFLWRVADILSRAEFEVS